MKTQKQAKGTMSIITQILVALKIVKLAPEKTEGPRKRSDNNISQLFNSIFGFHESFVRNKDFRDEMVITIMTLASKAKVLAKRRLRYPLSEMSKREYIIAIRDYHHAVELAHTVHPDFENIPMCWSRFPEFFEHWGKGAKPPRQDSSAIAEEALLLETAS